MTRVSEHGVQLLLQLAEAKRRSDELEKVSREIIIRALHEGVSYGRIGEIYGISRQAAAVKFGALW